ncbi:MAG: prepilin-type N-terminal cleavage/methylation domain-containing protein [Verrucomicrobiae bacterium]|nr:prepilin-type N-terminal cleavage/methylation domain-containing protein [Verrucomicrobiae bacterium]
MSGAELQGESRVRENFMHGLVGGVKPGRARSAMRGFTLTELLVTICILGVLSSFLMSALRNAREKARQIQCLANLKQCGMAFNLYMQDWDGALPPNGQGSGNWDNWFTDDAALKNIFGFTNRKSIICPTAKEQYVGPPTLPSTLTTYAFNQYVGKYQTADAPFVQQESQIKNPPVTVWMFDAVQANVGGIYYYWSTGASHLGGVLYCHSNGTNFLFCDGHVEWKAKSVLTNVDNFNPY